MNREEKTWFQLRGPIGQDQIVEGLRGATLVLAYILDMAYVLQIGVESW